MTVTPIDIAFVLAAHAEWLQNNWVGARADLSIANLCDADLNAANLKHANLNAANLRHADLRDANLCNADMTSADLRDADLRRANLMGADIRRADLTRADLRGANIDFSAWPLWCGSLEVKLDKRQQAQLLYHVLAVSPVARAMASQEMLDFANGSHVVSINHCERLVR